MHVLMTILILLSTLALGLVLAGRALRQSSHPLESNTEPRLRYTAAMMSALEARSSRPRTSRRAAALSMSKWIGCWREISDGLQLVWESAHSGITVTVVGTPPSLAGLALSHSDVIASE